MYINWGRVGIIAFFVVFVAVICLANFILDPADFRGAETIGLKYLHFMLGTIITGFASILCLIVLVFIGTGLYELVKWVTTPDPPDSSEETPPMPPVQNATLSEPEPKPEPKPKPKPKPEPEPEPEPESEDIPRTSLMDFS